MHAPCPRPLAPARDGSLQGDRGTGGGLRLEPGWSLSTNLPGWDAAWDLVRDDIRSFRIDRIRRAGCANHIPATPARPRS